MDVKIISNGSPMETTVVDAETGKPIAGFLALDWHIDTEGVGTVTATLDVAGAEIEGEVTTWLGLEQVPTEALEQELARRRARDVSMTAAAISLVGLEYRFRLVMYGAIGFEQLANLVHACIMDASRRLYVVNFELAVHERVAGRIPEDLEHLWGHPFHVVHDDETVADLTIRPRREHGATT